MQEYLGHQGRRDATLWSALGRVSSTLPLPSPPACSHFPSSLRIPPSLTRGVIHSRSWPQSRWSTHPLHIRSHSPLEGQLPALLPQVVQRLVGTVALPDAVGQRLQILRRRSPPGSSPLPAGPSCPRQQGVPLASASPLPAQSTPVRPAARHPDRSRSRSGRSRRWSSRCAASCCGRHVVHPGRTVLPGEMRGLPQARTVDQGKHVVAHHRLESVVPARQCSGVAWRRLVRPASLPEGLPDTRETRPRLLSPWSLGQRFPTCPAIVQSRLPTLRYSGLLRLPVPISGRSVLPLLPRYLASLACPLCPFSSHQGSPGRREFLPSAGSLSLSGRPSSSCILHKETLGSPKFPGSPHATMPWSETPVVSCTRRLRASRTVAFRDHCTPSAFSCFAGCSS